MALQSSIEWTEATWNPVTGCSKVSPGCKHCYAERMARRLQAMGVANYRNGFELAIHDQCRKADVAFYFKQWGGVQKKRNGRKLQGRTWDQMPMIPATVSTRQQGRLVAA